MRLSCHAHNSPMVTVRYRRCPPFALVRSRCVRAPWGGNPGHGCRAGATVERMSVQATSRAPQAPVTVRVFTMRFSATRLGARLARRLAVHRLHQWGFPYGSELSDSAAVVVAELAANAVTTAGCPAGTSNCVSRPCPMPTPVPTPHAPPPSASRSPTPARRSSRRPEKLASPPPDCETGRGLPLVAALAVRWGVGRPRPGRQGGTCRTGPVAPQPLDLERVPAPTT